MPKVRGLEIDTDIDFFVMIEPTVERNEFEELGKSVGFHALKKYSPYLRYSEHPYVEGKVNGIIQNKHSTMLQGSAEVNGKVPQTNLHFILFSWRRS